MSGWIVILTEDLDHTLIPDNEWLMPGIVPIDRGKGSI